jgi:hypothetical protein
MPVVYVHKAEDIACEILDRIAVESRRWIIERIAKNVLNLEGSTLGQAVGYA